MKKIVIGLVVVLLLLVLGAILLPFLVDLDRYKDTLLAQIRPYVPRDMDFEHVELTLLTGVGAEIQGLRVSENPRFGQGDFLELKSLKVRIRLLPLLKGEIRIGSVGLRQPVVHLIRSAQGEFNFADLAGGDGDGPAEEGRSERGAAPSAEPAGGVGAGVLGWLFVNDLDVQDGTVTFRDEALFPGAPPLKVHSLDLSVRDFSLTRPVALKLDAGLFDLSGQALHVDAVVGPLGESLEVERIPFRVSCKLDSLPWGAIPAAVRERALEPSPYQVLSGVLRVDLAADGSFREGIRTRSEWTVDDGVLQKVEDQKPAISSGRLQLSLREEALLRPAEETVEISSAGVALNGAQLVAKGRVTDYLGVPRWDLDLRAEGLDPQALRGSLPVMGVPLPDDMVLAGPAEIRVHSDGSAEAFVWNTQVDMSPLRIQIGTQFEKAADVPLTLDGKGAKEGDRLNVEALQVRLHDLTLNASGEAVTGKTTRFGFLAQSAPVDLKGWDRLLPSLADLQPEGSLVLRMSVRGEPADTRANLQVSSDRLAFRLPGRSDAPASDPASAAGSLSSVSLEAQAIRRPEQLQATGTLKIEKGTVQGVPFEQFGASVRGAREEVRLSGLDVRAFGGSVQATGQYRPESGGWSCRPELKDIAVAEVLERLTQYKNLLSGSLSGTFQVEGQPATASDARPTVTGSFRLNQGELKNFNLVGDVMQALMNMQNVAKLLGGMKGEMSQHASTKFDSLDGSFRFRDQALVLESVHFHNVHTSRSTDSEARFDGTAALDTGLLDLKGQVILSPGDSQQLVREADVLRALLNEQQRMVFPLTLRGRIQKPVPFLDAQYVVGAMTRYYARKGLEEGLGSLQKQLGIPQDGGTGKQKSDKPVEDLLRQLFK